MEFYFFDRDISWLFFNERVLKEADRPSVPIGERINFLSIYSSNLDEFYRVRIPTLMGVEKIDKEKEKGIGTILSKIADIIERQQSVYGRLIQDLLMPLREKHHIAFLYDQEFPKSIEETVENYFFTQVAAFLRPVFLEDEPDFFPENNKIYMAVSLVRKERREMAVINIPSDNLRRFFSVSISGVQYIVFLDDIILHHLKNIFPEYTVYNGHSFKITRDAKLDLKDLYEGDLADKIEEQLLKRNMGFATRFLYDNAMPETDLRLLVDHLKLHRANQMAGGRYHNLKEFSELPLPEKSALFYKNWPTLNLSFHKSIFQKMEDSDFLLNPPYENYQTLLRFFNEAALDKNVSEIYLTVYRIASDSQIAQSLISAAQNGKKVTVFVELKARFDEANNLHWGKKMKAAGVNIINSITGWKVHAKVALVKRKTESRIKYYGLLGTGNFNETTARVYADHILFTTHKGILRELELLFIFLSKRKRMEGNPYQLDFRHLLVARFNLFTQLKNLIEVEINQSKQGKPAAITLKLNNLDEERLIAKLYEASNAGVKIKLIIRSVCRLVPGVKGMSENIRVHRIVDRYLEHGRIFIFHHKGEEKIFSGSADWMKRNIRRRIEVCFPVYDEQVRQILKKSVKLGLTDNTQAVLIDENLNNIPIKNDLLPVQFQREFYKYLKNKEVNENTH